MYVPSRPTPKGDTLHCWLVHKLGDWQKLAKLLDAWKVSLMKLLCQESVNMVPCYCCFWSKRNTIVLLWCHISAVSGQKKYCCLIVVPYLFLLFLVKRNTAILLWFHVTAVSGPKKYCCLIMVPYFCCFWSKEILLSYHGSIFLLFLVKWNTVVLLWFHVSAVSSQKKYCCLVMVPYFWCLVTRYTLVLI